MTYFSKESGSTTNQPKSGTIEANNRILPSRSDTDRLMQPDFRDLMRRRRPRSRRRKARDLLSSNNLKPIFTTGTINPSSARRIA